MRMGLLRYSALTSAIAAGVVGNAFLKKQQFYPAVIYMKNSNLSLLAAGNFCLMLSLVLGNILRLIFFGTLRSIEVEHLTEYAWVSITETCLAMTVFRDDFSVYYSLLFGLLLLTKIAHWLVSDRIDYMEQTPYLPRIFHIRLVVLMAILICVDTYFVISSVEELNKNGPSMHILYGFEFSILLTGIIRRIYRYGLDLYDMSMEAEPWEKRSLYLFYFEVVCDFTVLTMYLCFLFVIMKYYGIPIHILRNLYITFRSFITKAHRMIQYRRATHNMNEKYPDATQEELEVIDKICIICREEMQTAKKLPCGHIFHMHCLRSWLERQQTCPTCRRSVLDNPSTNSENTTSSNNNNNNNNINAPHQPGNNSSSNESAASITVNNGSTVEAEGDVVNINGKSTTLNNPLQTYLDNIEMYKNAIEKWDKSRDMANGDNLSLQEILAFLPPPPLPPPTPQALKELSSKSLINSSPTNDDIDGAGPSNSSSSSSSKKLNCGLFKSETKTPTENDDKLDLQISELRLQLQEIMETVESIQLQHNKSKNKTKTDTGTVINKET